MQYFVFGVYSGIERSIARDERFNSASLHIILHHTDLLKVFATYVLTVGASLLNIHLSPRSILLTDLAELYYRKFCELSFEQCLVCNDSFAYCSLLIMQVNIGCHCR